MANPLGSAPSIILGVGLGAAASTAIEPVVESARQTAWTNNRVRILTPELNAALVAQGAIDLDAGRIQAHLEGLRDDKFDALVHLALRAPPHAEAQDLRRRGKITRDQLLHSFAKDQIEQQYWEALADLVDDRLSEQVAALAIVRGIMKDPGYLPVGPPTEVGNVPAFPVSQLDPLVEAAAHGINSDRLRVLVGIMGRPMGPESAAAAAFKGILKRTDFDRAIAEGDVRNEWASAIYENARQIPAVSDYINAEIRGWITTDERNAGIARHGMSPADGDLLYERTGRPATARQVFIGLRRGASRNGPVTDVPADLQAAVRQSDIRPEWTQIEAVNAVTYPTGFMIRGAVESGDLTPDQAKQLLYELGWAEKWIDLFVGAWTPSGQPVAKQNPYVVKADNQLWTALHKAYIKTGASRADVEPILTHLIPDTGPRDSEFTLWDLERQTQSLPAAPA